MFRKILVPTDFSEPAAAALKLACELAHSMGAVVELVHVCQLPLTIFPDGSAAIVSPEEASEILSRACAALEAAKRGADPGARLTTRLLEGAAVETIVGLAQEDDLIVMGTHGRTGLAHLFLGSVAERVLRHAKCPVLTVRSAMNAVVRAPDAQSAHSAG